MYGLKKKLNSYINTSIGISAFFAILGLFFVVFPETSIDVIRWLIVAVTGLSGLCLIAADFSRKQVSPFISTAIFGAVMIIIATVFAIYDNIMYIFPIIIGAWFIINGLSSVRFASTLRGTSAGSFSVIAAILSIICGIVLIFKPLFGSFSILIFAGIMMMIYGISNIAEMVVLKHNVKDISDTFKKLAKAPENNK